jgi:FMN reductase
MRIAVVVGNPKPQSRTLGVARAVADELGAAVGASADQLVIDLAEHAGSLFDRDAEPLGELTARVAASELIIAASPTYKASYTGMLKAFFDRYGSDGLAGSVAVAVMTGAGSGHALAAELHLRPLLVELGATVPARALYVTEAELPELGKTVAAWAETAGPLIRRALG